MYFKRSIPQNRDSAHDAPNCYAYASVGLCTDIQDRLKTATLMLVADMHLTRMLTLPHTASESRATKDVLQITGPRHCLHRFLVSSPDEGRAAAVVLIPVKLSPDLEESRTDSEPRSPDMLNP